MFFYSVCSFICQRLGQTVHISCAVIILLLVAQTESNATTPFHVDVDNLSVTMLASANESGQGDVENVWAAGRNNEFQIRRETFTITTSSHGTTLVMSDLANTDDESPSNYTASVNRIPDWDGIWRDTGILLGSQIVAAGLIYILPQSFSGWSDEQKDNSFKKYRANVTNPVFDKDKFYINYGLHPFWGGTYYIRGRERGLDKIQSFVYSTLISAMYEFGVECFFEKPSIQDLIVTPVVGSLVGAYIFEPLRESIKRKQELQWYDHAVLVFTDPVGVLSLGVEKMFGIKSTIMVDYSVPQLQNYSTKSVSLTKDNRIGVVMQFPFN